ncbi:MAG TPA: hypothetical protein VLQ48_00815 [Chloroflexia bacterium]|nr:hypothetical protein [Chloroflexia bacterium]
MSDKKQVKEIGSRGSLPSQHQQGHGSEGDMTSLIPSTFPAPNDSSHLAGQILHSNGGEVNNV